MKSFKRPAYWARGRIRKPKNGPNKTELAYEVHLEKARLAGDILWWAFERIKLKLADKTFYTPDFLVMRQDFYLEIHEVKGFWEDDARVKIKVAAEQFPIFKFIAARLQSKRAGGGWLIEEF